jgi:hypothetical protein
MILTSKQLFGVWTDVHNGGVLEQMSGLHSRSSAEMDAGSHTYTKRLMQLADEVLDHKSMEHLPFGGRMPLIASNRERLDWFADQLVLEHKSRSSRKSPTVILKPSSTSCPQEK